MELNENVQMDTPRSLSAVRRTKLKAAQIRLFYAQSGIGSMGAFLGAVILGGVLWKLVSHERIVVWVLAYAALFLGRYYLIHCFHRQERDDDAVISWGKWHSLVVNTGGLLWGVAGVWLFPQDSILHQFLLCIFVAGIAAAATVIYSPTEDYAANLLLALLPLSGRFIYEFDEFHVITGGVILLFAGVLLLTGRRMHTVYADSLRLRSDNQELVEDLKHEIARRDVLEAELTKARDGLETQVQARTAELTTLNRTLEQEIVVRTQVQESYRLLVENLNDVIFSVNAEGEITFMSPAVERISHYKVEDIVGRPLQTFIHPGDVPGLMERYQKVLQGEIAPYEYRLLDKDGSLIHVRSSSRPMYESGGPVGLTGIMTDITERKRAEEALRGSEKRYRELVEKANDIIYRTDANGVFVLFNSVGLRITGYSLEEITHKHYLDLIHPDYKKQAERFYGLQFVKRIPDTYYEMPIITKKGETVWIGQNAQLVMEGDAIVGFQSIARDITDLKKAEDVMRQQRDFLQQLIDAIPTPIFYKDVDGRYIGCNRAFESDTGMSRADIVGKTVFEVGPPDLAQIYHEQDLSLLRNPGVQQGETSRQDAAGSRHEVVFTKATFSDLEGNIAGLVGVILDITERKKAEQALKASETRYRRLFEAAKDGILILDAETAQIVDVNPFLTDLLGYSREDFLERKIWEIGIFEDTSKSQAVFLELQSGEYVRYEDLPLQKKGGSSVEVEFVSNVYQVNSKKVIQCNIRDISDRKRLERQLIQSQKMEAVGILAGGVAHDFNNLLTVVQGYSELLLLEMDEKTPGYSDLRKIHEAGLRGAELVRNLLAFSRKADTNPRPINLNDEVARIQKLLSRTIPKMIKIELHLEGDLAAVDADPDQIGQVLMNLAVNSEHAMLEGGKLTIATANISLDEEYCRSYPEMHAGNYAMLTVSDTGHGMDKETLQHIFEPFFTTKGIGKGTGLGLSMVYGIIRQHGGHITCYSEPNHGTTFKIYLPAMKEDVMGKEAEVEQVLPRGGTETILLVDDEDFIRDLGQRFLTRAGYTVLTAASGPEAVQLYLREGEKISLMILDLIMPEMGGDKCLEEILAINPDAKIVISSGAAVKGKKKETVESGARGFVSKPFQLRDMLKTVREVLDEG
jgi:two-component system, cell cycle sensor histidine kinase and response regulator CckA